MAGCEVVTCDREAWNAIASLRRTGSLYPFVLAYVSRPIIISLGGLFRFNDGEYIPTFAIPDPTHVFDCDHCISFVPFAKH